MASEGDQTFFPNPSSAAQGSQISWVNTDSEVHHIAATDGSFDTGEIAPGATSAAMVLGTNGAHYYCTLHPSEVGSITAR
jgi:plastocyanin